MQVELLQPWSTFVMATRLPSAILEKMIRIADEIIKKGEKESVGAGQIKDQFLIDPEILEQEELMDFFLDMCRKYIVQAFCQTEPFNKENILKEEWFTRLTGMWINSQKDNEYFPIHTHTTCNLSSVIYLKIPEYLPSRRFYNNPSEDGSIIFTNNSSQDIIWGTPTLQIQPEVGDFFIFPASQQHLVYPFRTADGKGERRSVSFNAEFSSKTEQDTLKKQQKAI